MYKSFIDLNLPRVNQTKPKATKYQTMKIQVIKFKNGKYGVRHFVKHRESDKETFLSNEQSFHFYTRRTTNFVRKCMFEYLPDAMLKLEAYKAYKLALEEDKLQSNSPVAEVLHEWKLDLEE